MKRVNVRLWSARSQCCRWASVTSKVITHDYKRQGITTLFAALNVIDVTVLAKCELRHRHQEFLSFLREIDKAVPMELDIHCIIDNYADPQSPEDQGLARDQASLAHARHSHLQLLA
ncbi:poly(A) polymerase Pap1 [Bradyrhizobium sp. USDA 4518]